MDYGTRLFHYIEITYGLKSHGNGLSRICGRTSKASEAPTMHGISVFSTIAKGW